MLTRDKVAVIGCAVPVAVFIALYILANVAQIDHEYQKARGLLISSFVVLFGGIVILVIVFGVMVWLHARRTKAGYQALTKRAERLRAERKRQRAEHEAQLEASAREVAPGRPARIAQPQAPLVLDLADTDIALPPPPPAAAEPQAPATLDLSDTGVGVAAPPIAVARAARDVGMCPFCQTKVLEGEQYLTCPSCKTPYHADCWEHNNGCAVYGCPVRIRT